MFVSLFSIFDSRPGIMMQVLIPIFLFIFGIQVLPTQAQDKVSGQVLDARTEAPLAGANVVQVGTQNGTTSDQDGRFKLKLRSDGSRKLKITYVGYKPRKIDLQERSSPLRILLVPETVISDQVFVKAVRVDEASPITYQNISVAEIRHKNQGQDIPYLVQNLTSVTASSDAGAGIGYTSMRIRGIDQRRINVTINGIPLNDAESHGVFWVDIPNLAASVKNIQIQRGVGTSTNGAAAFGATMNLQTTSLKPDPHGSASVTTGSFDTRKYNLEAGTGLMENGWQVNARLSKISSEGYIDRAFSDLKSYYASVSRYGDRSLLNAVAFSGKEQTYQAWYGVPGDSLESNRTYNPAGQEKSGDPYDNQTDNYQQDHYQLHYSYRLSDGWDLNTSLHMTFGRGYYEEYKANEMLSNYGVAPVQFPDTTIHRTDLIRDRWLENWFYGTVFSSTYKAPENWSLTVGGAYNEYDGRHFGKLNWARYASGSTKNQTYYDNSSFKTDFNLYTKLRYHLTDQLTAYADLQYRAVTYDFLGKDVIDEQTGNKRIIDLRQHDALHFWNPKGGFTYRLTPDQHVYASFSMGNKEPTREEYVNSTPDHRPQHESLYDWEAGYRGQFDRWSGQVNFYYMFYRDQLIQTGEVNDVGAPVRQNVPQSYRAGVELQGGARLSRHFEWQANATLSRNKIDRYSQFLTNYGTGRQIARRYENTDIAFSPELITNSILTYRYKSLEATWTFKYVSRQYLDNTESKSRSIDPYWINDLRLQYTFPGPSPLPKITATLQVNNVLDHLYETGGYTFGFISGGSEIHQNYYYPQAGRNYLLELRMKF